MFLFRKYKTAILIAAVLIVSLSFVFYGLRYGSERILLKKIVMEIASPVQGALDYAVKSIRDAWLRYIFLVGIQEENKNLRKKIGELEATINTYKEGYLEAQRLRKILAVENESNHTFVCARVIGKELGSLSRTLLINKGSSDGLRTGMPVLAPPGLIGRLTDVSWHYSKVLLLIDENSNMDAVVQRNRTQGIISGAGPEGMILKYVPQTQDVQKGDVIVSSGIGGVFPAGLMVGLVHDVDRKNTGLFLKISVLPFTDLSKLEEVLVLTSAAQEIH
ncbi:MAG TPA: rod shape-determining protein MreC [Smithella sp.]|nr:rod shape-determining protein MreC [Smithella sp.]